MALECGLVIYNRPCRANKPRHYTVCDVARIAESAVRHGGAAPDIVLATVAERLGYSNILNGEGLDQKSLEETAKTILKTAGTIEDLTSEIPVFSKLGILIALLVQFAGSISFVIGFVSAKIIAGRKIGHAVSCKRK